MGFTEEAREELYEATIKSCEEYRDALVDLIVAAERTSKIGFLPDDIREKLDATIEKAKALL